MGATWIRSVGSRVAMYLLLFGAFAIVGAGACFLVYSAALQNSRERTRDELTTLAKVIARQIDPVQHEKLVARNQQDSPAYREQVDRLQRLLKDTPALKYVYTLRPVQGKMRFVLDPTPPGDRDGDGVDDKSYLMDTYGQATPLMWAVYSKGLAQSESEPMKDRWGNFLSAYAPLVGPDGRVVAILGVDREYDSVLAQESAFLSMLRVGLGVVVAVGAGLAWILVAWTGVLRGEAMAAPKAASTGARRTLLEMVLFLIVCSLMVYGVFGHVTTTADLNRLNRLVREKVGYDTLRERLESISASNSSSAKQFEVVEAEARKVKLPWVETELGKIRRQMLVGDAGYQRALSEVLGTIRLQLLRIQETRLELSERIADRSQTLTALFTVAVLMSFGCLALIRHTGRQQQNLVVAIQETSSLQAVYKQLVDVLPVGLMTFRHGECTFANPEWRMLCDASEEDSIAEAFENAIYPEDRSRVFEAFDEHEISGEPFMLNFRIESATGQVRYIESKGVPVFDVDGRLNHLLAFCLDNTAEHLARIALEERSEEVQLKNRLLSKALEELNSNVEAMTNALSKAVEAKDPYTAGHSERVMLYSMMIGRAMNLPKHELQQLERGTLVHDIGKIGIPDVILTKPSRLDDHEFEIVKTHPMVGYGMIETLPVFTECAPIVRWHHERLDGSGYPDGLTADEIPLLVRIAAVADVFDAMTSTRAYRKGLAIHIAIEELRKEGRAGKLDLEIVEMFADMITGYGVIEQSETKAA